MHDIEGKIRTKVLAELMHHMVSLHGKSQHSAALPDPAGGSKHDPAKVSLHGGMSDESKEPPSLGEALHHSEEEKGEAEHDLGDLFGRKKKSGMTEF